MLIPFCVQTLLAALPLACAEEQDPEVTVTAGNLQLSVPAGHSIDFVVGSEIVSSAVCLYIYLPLLDMPFALIVWACCMPL